MTLHSGQVIQAAGREGQCLAAVSGTMTEVNGNNVFHKKVEFTTCEGLLVRKIDAESSLIALLGFYCFH